MLQKSGRSFIETNSVRFEKCEVLFPFPLPTASRWHFQTRRAGAQRSKKVFLRNEAKFFEPYLTSMFLIMSVLSGVVGSKWDDAKLVKTSQFEGEKGQKLDPIKPKFFLKHSVATSGAEVSDFKNIFLLSEAKFIGGERWMRLRISWLWLFKGGLAPLGEKLKTLIPMIGEKFTK